MTEDLIMAYALEWVSYPGADYSISKVTNIATRVDFFGNVQVEFDLVLDSHDLANKKYLPSKVAVHDLLGFIYERTTG